MSKIETVIRAIEEMDIDLLDLVLDTKKSYMDVSKEQFLSKLSSEFGKLKKKGISEFNIVSKGNCQKCYKDYSGFTFSTKNNDYLDLLFLEKDNEITDIIQCTKFKNEERLTKEKNIFLYFKKDNRISYKPTSTLSFEQIEIEKAELEFKEFENQIIDLETLEIWKTKWTKLFNSVRYKVLEYSFVPSFISTYSSTKQILSLKKEKTLAEKALIELKYFEISEHRKLINWLLKFKDNQVFNASTSYIKTDNITKTNFIIFKNGEDIFNDGLKYYENIVIDIKGYLNSIKFGEIYSKYYYEFYNEIEQNQETAE